MELTIDKIRNDGGTQPRASILIEVVDDYAEKMSQGETFPPAIVFFDGKEYWLADGFHRLEAWRRARPEQPMPVEVVRGTQSDAQWYSFGVNKTHGLRRTNEDKARAVRAALQHPQGVSKSDSDIARHVGVDHKTVAKYRSELESSWEIPKMRERTVARGGTTYQQNTSNISGRRRSDNATSRSTLKVHAATRLPNPVPKMTALSLPHDPVMGARTLIQLFDADYLDALIEALNQLRNHESQTVSPSTPEKELSDDHATDLCS